MNNHSFTKLLLLAAICFQPFSAMAENASELAGLYWCIAPSWSSGTIKLLPDGTYQMNGSDAGHYKAESGHIQFDGQLKGWNNGVARIEKDNLIFKWKDKEGWQQYFAYRKGKK